MPTKIEYRKQAHCTYHTRYHLVFVTKYRRKIFRPGMAKYLEAILSNITRKYPEVEILEMNTDEDHIHLLLTLPPKLSISDAVRLLKANSARAMIIRFPFLRTIYDQDHLGLWSDGYFVSTVGADEQTIKRYIQLQGEEDKGQMSLDI